MFMFYFVVVVTLIVNFLMICFCFTFTFPRNDTMLCRYVSMSRVFLNRTSFRVQYVGNVFY